MAKAKKKLNTNLLAVTTIVATGLLLAGGGTTYFVYKSKRPDQLKAEGRELMLKGDYNEAFKRFSRAGSRKTTDPEFLTWMQETESHLTSFDPMHYHASYGLLSAIISASSDKFPPTLKKVEADLVKIETFSADQISLDVGKDFDASAKTVLERDAKNTAANRVRAFVKVLPLFQPGGVPTSTEVQTIVEAAKAMNESLPDDPELAYRYTLAMLKHREALVREGSISNNPGNENALTIFGELRRMSDHLLEVGRNEANTPDDRARAYGRAFDIMQITAGLQVIPKDAEKAYTDNMVEAVAKASELVTPKSDYYLDARYKYALGFLFAQKRFEEAEKVLRESVDQLPKQWQPRMVLANLLSDAGKPEEALKVLDVEKQPDYDLVGIDGFLFDGDAKRVPLRRAFYRMQTIPTIADPAARAAEIVKVETDYKTATSKQGVGENDVYALQVQAGLMEIAQNRTGALQKLDEAISRLPDTAEQRSMRTKILKQQMVLNDSLGQTGRAEDIATQIMRLQPTDFPSLLKLIEFKIRNNKVEEAKKMLDQAKTTMPDHPALAALYIRLLPTAEAKRKELEKIPETGPTPEATEQLVLIKMHLADSVEVLPLVGEVAERYLKDHPDHYRVTMKYVQALLKQNKREEALRRLNSLKAKDPTDTNVDKAIEIVNASDNPEKLQELLEAKASESSPVAKIMIEAQKLLPGDPDGYLKKMYEAEAIDKTGDATQRIYYYVLNALRLDEAEKQLDKLAKLGRDPSEIRTNRMRISLARAGLMQAEGKIEESNKLFDKVVDDANTMVREMPQFSGAWVIKGLALNARGKLDEAFDAFYSAREQQPNNVEAVRYSIELAGALNRGEEMKKLIDAGKRISPSDPYYEEAQLRYEVSFGDPKAAIEPRVKQRDDKPEDPNAWQILGNTYLAASKKSTNDAEIAELRKSAIDTYKKAAEKFTELPGFSLAAAGVLSETGDAAGASAVVDGIMANEKFMANPQFLASLASYFVDVKQNDKALDVLSKLLAMKQGNTYKLRSQMARLYAESGRVDEALATLDSLPETAETQELRINLLLAAQKIDEANKLANANLAKEKTVSTLLMAAHTEGVLKNVARSVALANEAVEMEPANPNTHLYKAKMMLRERPMRNPEILELLNTVKRLAPKNVEARLLLSERLDAIGRVDESVNELESVVADMPDNRDLAVRLIRSYMTQRPMPDSRIGAVFEKLHKDKMTDAQILSLEVNWNVQRNDLFDATKAAKQALETDPNNVVLYRQLIDVMVRDKKFKDVLVELDRVQAANPNVYWTYMTRGLVLHKLRREADASKEWDKALSMAMSLKDDSPTGQIVEVYAGEYGSEATGRWLSAQLGQDARMRALMLSLYSKESQHAKAIEMGESLKLEMGKLNVRTQVMVLNSLGNAYLTATPSSPARARLVFEDLIKIDAENPLALNNLAYAMMLEGTDLPAAAKIAEKAYDMTVQSGSPNAFIGDTYGWALIQSGKVREGVEVLLEAKAVQEIPDIAYHLGEAYILQNQKDAAEQSLQNALALVQLVSKNGGSVDAGLEPRIREAMVRASAMSVQ